jgi:hypothetical protein
VLAFEVVEANGVTPSSIGGHAILTPNDPHDWATAREFSRGRGALGWMKMEYPGLRWLTFLLRDGELIRLPVEDAWLRRRTSSLSVVRETGRPAALRLACDDELLAWPDPTSFVEIGGTWQKAASAARIAERPGSAAAWMHDGELLVQTWERAPGIGRVAFVAPDGRIAMSDHGELVAQPSRALRPIDPRELIERFARPAGLDYLLLRHDIALPLGSGGEEVWMTLRYLRLHRVEGLGWRLSRTASIDRHEPLPDALPIHAWRVGESRVRLRVRGRRDWVDVPP